MAYRLGAAAARDVLGIAETGIRLFGIEQAARYHARLTRSFELLGDSPRLARERREFDPPMRVHPCGSHVIVYRIDEDGDVLIVRVRHGREDWESDPLGEPVGG